MKIPEMLRNAENEMTWIALLSGVIAEVVYPQFSEKIASGDCPELLADLGARLHEVLNLEFDEEQVTRLLSREGDI